MVYTQLTLSHFLSLSLYIYIYTSYANPGEQTDRHTDGRTDGGNIV